MWTAAKGSGNCERIGQRGIVACKGITAHSEDLSFDELI